MGWKNIKEHYCIGHIVQVTSQGICIGSPYIHNIIVIGFDGVFKKRYKGSDEDLNRYQRQMDSDQELLKSLINKPDKFYNSITVWTYNDLGIIEKQCETLGWPNTTHDGLIMYENIFFTNKSQAICAAKRNAELKINHFIEEVHEIEKRIEKLRNKITEQQEYLAKLCMLGE